MYGSYAGPPSVAELDRCFLLDDKACGLIESKRLPHTRLGYAVQLTTFAVHWSVPGRSDRRPDRGRGLPGRTARHRRPVVCEGLPGAGDDPARARHADPRRLRVRRVHRGRRGAGAVGGRPGVDPPGTARRPCSTGALVWLREHQVLLPGVSTLAQLVARVRDTAMQRLWDTLAAPLTAAQATALEHLLEIPDGARTSDLERPTPRPDPGVGPGWRTSPDPQVSERASRRTYTARSGRCLTAVGQGGIGPWPVSRARAGIGSRSAAACRSSSSAGSS